MNRRTIFLLIILLLLASTAAAGDGGKFIMLGMGYSPTINRSFDENSITYEDSHNGIAIQVGIGYQWNQKHVLLVDRFLAFEGFTSSDLIQGPGPQISYMRFFNSKKPSMFVSIGAGQHFYNQKGLSSGLGLTLGVGREISNKFMGAVYHSWGQSKKGSIKYQHRTLFLMLIAVWR